jgi:hypothetical protein
VTKDELIIPLQILITNHEKLEKYRSAKKQNNFGKRVIKHNGIQQKSTKKEEGLPEKKKVTIHQKRKRFSGKELRSEFQMACLKSVPFTTR